MAPTKERRSRSKRYSLRPRVAKQRAETKKKNRRTSSVSVPSRTSSVSVPSRTSSVSVPSRRKSTRHQVQRIGPRSPPGTPPPSSYVGFASSSFDRPTDEDVFDYDDFLLDFDEEDDPVDHTGSSYMNFYNDLEKREGFIDSDDLEGEVEPKVLHLDSNAIECTICLDTVTDDYRVEEINACKHRFHKSCLQSWMRQNKNCPVCRRFVPAYKFTDKDSETVEKSNSRQDELDGIVYGRVPLTESVITEMYIQILDQMDSFRNGSYTTQYVIAPI